MKDKGFGLVSVIIIMVITSIVSGITTGVIMLNNNSVDMSEISNDKDLKDFIEVYEVLLSKYYDEIDKKAMLEAAEDGMMNFLGDKYTTYLQDTEYQEIVDELSATYVGIGIELDGKTISGFVEDSPASKSGLLVGDILTKVNDTDINDLSGEQVSQLIKNSNESYISLEVKRNNATLFFKVKKEKLPNKVVSYKVLEDTNIGYLFIKNFAENLDEQTSDALKDLESKGISSLIIDLRDNAGGYLQAAEATSSLFLEEGKVIYSLKNSDNEVVHKDKTKDAKTYPIVVLIDNNTASAAEILAAALHDSYGAILVGSRSFGKGKVQEVIKLDNGDSVKTTSAKWFTPAGDCIDTIGITPDYNEILFKTGLYNDSQIQKAVDVLKALG